MDFQFVEMLIQSPALLIGGLAVTIVALLFCAIQLLRYGPAIKRLNKLEVLSQLYSLGEQQREMTTAFGRATAASNAAILTVQQLSIELEGLREFITDAQEKMSEYNADLITKARIAQVNEELPAGTFYRNIAAGMSPPQQPAARFQNMKNEWARFLEAFKERLAAAKIPAQLNRIGKMTYLLTDRRRRDPLSVETADLITALHSQYRRYIALRDLSSEEHDDFVRLVKTAIAELQAPTERPSSSFDGNAPRLPLQ